MAGRRPEPTPAQRALALLVRREHSRPELARKLRARGISVDEAHGAVERMTESGWQDDLRFACSLVRSRVAGGQGPVRIRAELASHDIAEAVVEEAFAALAQTGEGDWLTRARDMVRRRFGAGLDTLPLRRKAADFLLRRGFDGDVVRAVTRAGPIAVD